MFDRSRFDVGVDAGYLERDNEDPSMTASTEQKSAPGALVAAARLRHEGRLNEGVALVEAALGQARATPLGVPFRDRVLIGLALADLYLATDQTERARSLLVTEAAFAEDIFLMTRRTGTPDQVRTASAGHYQVRDRATQVALLGQAAPEIEVADWVLGQQTTLAEQRGRVVMLEFWARWCRPCLAMFPMLRDLHRRYHEHGLTILALTRYGPDMTDDPAAQRVSERNAIGQTIADRGLEIAIGIAPDGRLQQQYGAIGMPTFALVDQTGTVRFASATPDKTEVERAVASLLTTTTDGDSYPYSQGGARAGQRNDDTRPAE
jgi:thiol-disulfide isomerase/thioredoxin